MATLSPDSVLQVPLERIILTDFLEIDGMTQREIEEEEEERRRQQVVVEEKIYVAVGKDVKDNKSTLLWALQHLGEKKLCILHVHQPSYMIPFMGGKFPADKLKEQEVKAYRDLEKQKMQKILNEYLSICSAVGVQAEKLDIEKDNIEKGITELVSQHGIKRLVMGAAADKHYTKRMTSLKSKKAIFVNQQAHISCHIWFVCKGGLIHTRKGSLGGTEILVTQTRMANLITATAQADRLRSRSMTEGKSDHVRLTNPFQSFIRRVNSHGGRVATTDSLDGIREILTPQPRLSAGESVNEWGGILRGSPSQGSGLSTWSSNEEVVGSSESISLMRDEGSEDGSILSSIQESEEDIRRSSPLNEFDKGRIDDEMLDQLQQAMAEAENSRREAFEESVKRRKAEKDAIEAISKVKASESLYANEVKQRKEMEEMLARDTLEIGRMKIQLNDTIEELAIALDQKSALKKQMSDSERMLKELEDKLVSAVELLITFKQARDGLQVERDDAVKEAEELRKRREEETTSSQRPHISFSFSEILEATCNFDPSLIIGEGGYGSIYRGFLRNTEVAIKVLQSNSLQGRSKYQQEEDVMSRMRHPNLLTLIGTCPEAWSLIYEYLPNGSLEDRLTCKDNALPLSWQMRIRIAVEICSALIFLHSNNPHSIIHGNLNPANILLDANFVSKLGGVGICRSVSGDEVSSSTSTSCCRTNPNGTSVYMDLEFLSTGELTPQSDVYSFGIILLRLLTGRSPLGIVKEVQCALEKANLSTLLDASAGDWPFVQAKQLAHLALRCCEVNRNSRPDLASQVWRVLEPMKTACGASSSFRLGSEERCESPSYFICPIFQEIMRNPHIAADGFTYEAEALRGWLDSGHNTSPMTNLKLAHCNLIPNLSLRSAIEEWRQQR